MQIQTSRFLRKKRIRQPSNNFFFQFKILSIVRRFSNKMGSLVPRRFIPQNLKDIDQKAQDNHVLGIPNDTVIGQLSSFFFFFFTFFQLFLLNFLISFQEWRNSWGKLTLIIGLVVTCLLMTHSFLFQRQEQGLAVINLKQIRNSYLKNISFYNDLTTLILNFASIFDWHFAIPLFALILIKVPRLTAAFQLTFVDSPIKDKIWKILYLIIINIIIANTVTCIFNILPSINPQKNWMTEFNIIDLPWYEKYAWSWYWSITTIMTVGYGDISAKNYYQAIIVSAVEFVGGIMYIYNINKIGTVLQAINSQTQELISKLRLLRNFFKKEKNKLNDIALQNQIYNSVRNSIRMQQKLRTAQLVSTLSGLQEGIQNKLFIKLRFSIMKQLNFFSEMGKDALKSICLSLRQNTLFNGQNLSLKGQFSGKISVICSGSVVGFMKRSYDHLQLLQRKCTEHNPLILGFGAMFNLKERINSKAKGICQTLQIDCNQMLSILRSTKLQKQRFCQFRDQFHLHGSLFLNQDCQTCLYNNHGILDCPFYHYIPIRTLTIRRDLNREQESRFKYLSRNRLKTLFFIDNGNLKQASSHQQVNGTRVLTQKLMFGVIPHQINQDAWFQRSFQFKYYMPTGNAKSLLDRYNLKARISKNFKAKRTFYK